MTKKLRGAVDLAGEGSGGRVGPEAVVARDRREESE